MSNDHKRGDSFTRLLAIPAEFANGYFVGWEAKCQIYDSQDRLVAEAVTEWLDPATTRNLKIRVADTRGWTPGTMSIDVQFTRTSDGEVMSTTTATFNVLKDVTR